MPALPIYEKLREHGSFVLVEPPYLVLPSGEPWTTLVPQSLRDSLNRPLLRCRTVLEDSFLPGSLGSLRFLPTALSARAVRAMADWRKASCTLRRYLQEHASELLGAFALEGLAGLFVKCHKESKGFASSAEKLRTELSSLIETGLLFSPPVLCPVDINAADDQDGMTFDQYMDSFISRSWSKATRCVAQTLRRAAGRSLLFENCTDAVFSRRHYYAKHLGCLPVECWKTWFTVFGNKPAIAAIGELMVGRVPERDPGRRAAVKICRLLAAVVDRFVEATAGPANELLH